MLAQIGALNNISADTKLHRRDALWQVEKAGQRVGKLLEGVVEQDAVSPLEQMDAGRAADFRLSRDRTDDWSAPDVLQAGRNAQANIKSAAELRERHMEKKPRWPER